MVHVTVVSLDIVIEAGLKAKPLISTETWPEGMVVVVVELVVVVEELVEELVVELVEELLEELVVELVVVVLPPP